MQLSRKTGDRFADVDWVANSDGSIFVRDAAAWLDCTVHEEVRAGDHGIVLLEIHGMGANLDTPPLVFHASRFRKLVASPEVSLRQKTVTAVDDQTFRRHLTDDRHSRKALTMRAVQLTGRGSIEMREVPVPDIEPDEVLVRVAAAGVCHSDLHIIDAADESWEVFGRTLGHETAGHIARTGSLVEGFDEGDPVLLTLTWFCGYCRNCVQQKTNACLVAGSRTGFTRTPGVGPDGGMAEYIKVKAIHIDHIGDLDPGTAAPLADAGTTPMHAIDSAREQLTPDATVVVIGIGGLGHLGLQILKATTGSRIIALDTDDVKLALARKHGADLVLRSDTVAAETILAEVGGIGADAVFDFVGVAPTVTLATQVVAASGALRLVGLGGGGGGGFEFIADGSGEILPWGVSAQRSNGGTHNDQRQVIALAQGGKLHVETVRYSLDDYRHAFDDLREGRVTGRAILVP